MERMIGETAYQIGKMDARKQLHVVRRLVPTLLEAVPLAELKDIKSLDLTKVVSKLGPLSDALASMKDEDVDYIIDTCLAVVSRKVDGDRGWAPLITQGGGMMYDIDLGTMMSLTFEVVQENLQGFFDALQSVFQAAVDRAA